MGVDGDARTWIRTGPPENQATREQRTLAFQGRIRTISPYDADVLLERPRAAAGIPA